MCILRNECMQKKPLVRIRVNNMPSDIDPSASQRTNASSKPDFLLKLLPEIPSDRVFPKSHMAPAFLILKVI